jgi:hypothetical protein
VRATKISMNEENLHDYKLSLLYLGEADVLIAVCDAHLSDAQG